MLETFIFACTNWKTVVVGAVVLIDVIAPCQTDGAETIVATNNLQASIVTLHLWLLSEWFTQLHAGRCNVYYTCVCDLLALCERSQTWAFSLNAMSRRTVPQNEPNIACLYASERHSCNTTQISIVFGLYFDACSCYYCCRHLYFHLTAKYWK